MFIKQLSVFIEKKKGRLGTVAEVLKENNINIVSLSIADASEYSILRMIVSNPEEGEKTLRKAGFTTRLSQVISVKTAQEPGTLFDIIKIFEDNDVQIEYIYPLATSSDQAAIILKIQEDEMGLKILKESNYMFTTEDEAYGLK